MLAAAVLVVLALGLRLGEVERAAYRPVNDAGSYLALGREVAQHGDYAASDPGAGGSRGPTAYFAPGYPYLLAGVDRLTGETRPSSGEIRAARVASAVLGTVTVGLVGLLTAELLGPAGGLLALALAAVYPVLIELSGVLAVENLFVVLELLAVLAALRARRSAHPLTHTGLAGFAVGLVALVHEDGVLLVIPLLLAVRGLSPRRLLAPVVLLAVTAMTIAPWVIRDAVVLHRLVPISDESGITLAGTYNPTSAHASPPYRWLPFTRLPEFRSLARTAPHLSETALDTRLEHRALHYIGAHPTAPLVVAVDNTRRLLELSGAHAWEASAASIGLSLGTARIGVWSFWILALVALAGLATPAVRRIPRWLWLVPVLLWLSVVLTNAETPRFREPLEPFLIVLAAAALQRATRRFAPRGGLRASPRRATTGRFASPG